VAPVQALETVLQSDSNSCTEVRLFVRNSVDPNLRRAWHRASTTRTTVRPSRNRRDGSARRTHLDHLRRARRWARASRRSISPAPATPPLWSSPAARTAVMRSSSWPD